MENLNPMEGGDTRLVPMNMLRIDSSGEVLGPQPNSSGGVPVVSGSSPQKQQTPEPEPP